MVRKPAVILRRLARAVLLMCASGLYAAAAADTRAQSGPQFQTSDRCLACHNGMTTSSGQDLSIGIDWRASVMANSSRDPYWQASVRRETIDHAGSQAAIEDECSVCHMPIVRYEAKTRGRTGQVFVHLPLHEREAADGVSCSVCHQITPEGLGTPESFNGNFVVGGANAAGEHPELGPFDIDPGLSRVMHSSTGGFQPERGDHIRSAQLCASCHTLITKALGPDGRQIGSLPEQVPYQEWLHSEYRERRTCQSCHMPAVQGETPIARILGVPRPGVARHEFVAANFFMQRMLDQYHDELRVAAQPQELAAAADRTVQYLQTEAARISISNVEVHGNRLMTEVAVENLGGHKLPTAYPSRRAWLHFVVFDRDANKIFESGALHADGSIEGDDNDADPTRYEPHYHEIDRPDEVQIYESILADAHGGVTTGLLSAVGYLKDNRLLPHGFDKSTAAPEIAVQGAAAADPAFTDRGDRIRYVIELGAQARGPYRIVAQLWYQPIGYRWANNLKAYGAAAEPRRFTDHYDAMANTSATLLAKAELESK
jgi:cytochrome c551/c552